MIAWLSKKHFGCVSSFTSLHCHPNHESDNSICSQWKEKPCLFCSPLTVHDKAHELLRSLNYVISFSRITLGANKTLTDWLTDKYNELLWGFCAFEEHKGSLSQRGFPWANQPSNPKGSLPNIAIMNPESQGPTDCQVSMHMVLFLAKLPQSSSACLTFLNNQQMASVWAVISWCLAIAHSRGGMGLVRGGYPDADMQNVRWNYQAPSNWCWRQWGQLRGV